MFHSVCLQSDAAWATCARYNKTFWVGQNCDLLLLAIFSGELFMTKHSFCSEGELRLDILSPKIPRTVQLFSPGLHRQKIWTETST